MTRSYNIFLDSASNDRIALLSQFHDTEPTGNYCTPHTVMAMGSRVHDPFDMSSYRFVFLLFSFHVSEIVIVIYVFLSHLNKVTCGTKDLQVLNQNHVLQSFGFESISKAQAGRQADIYD